MPNRPSHEAVLRGMPHQAGKLATAAHAEATDHKDIATELQRLLPAREHTDDDPFVDRHVDSIIDAAVRDIAARQKEIHDGHGAVSQLRVDHSNHLFEATAARLTEALSAPVVIDSRDTYYDTMHDTEDRNVHVSMKDGKLIGYIEPTRVAQYLQGTTPNKMAWIEQADGSNELFLPTATGVWIDIRSGHPTDPSDPQHTTTDVPEILLIVPSTGQ